MEMLKDFKFDVSYYPGKANLVEDALSRKRALEFAAPLMVREWDIVEFVRDFDMKLIIKEPYEVIAHIQVQPTINSKIIEAQEGDELLKKMKERAKNDVESKWRIGTDGGLWYRGRVCVPNLQGLREEVLNAAHNSKLAIHPGNTKMYRDLKRNYWLNNMKKEITNLPKTRKRHDSIWVIVDRLTQLAHFLPIKTSNSVDDLTKLYIKEIVRLHGVSLEIVLDRDTQFMSIFCTRIQETMGVKLKFSTAFHLQIDGQTERVNQILEDMLRACVLDFQES
ncbi:uncharacterized protein LOC131217591 [Magnolia sinica]|uniref:uncharacterized protein LOC131217591 n=1 Tax=Magnolia sinica TaxID=86752 RepID=UPI002658380F|nr:uncharacterized protein LOC131217591 [Magnolia sinica]